MKPTIPQLQAEKRKIEDRLKQARGGMAPLDEGAGFTTERIHFELSARLMPIRTAASGS